MYNSVKRIPVLKCLSNEVSNFSPRASNWIRIFRRSSSGLKEKKAESLENLADDLSFSSFLQQRQEEARRSFLIRVYDLDVWPSLFNMCSSAGKIRKAFHYESVSYEKNQYHFLLIEMNTEAQLNDFLKKTLKINPGSDHYNQFLVLNENNILFKNNSKKKTNYNNQFDSYSGDDSDKKTKNNEKLINISQSYSKKLLNKELINTNNNLSDLIRNCYNILKINDIETRKRFLMCRQIEVLCSGFLPNAVAYPFGSSINGFGVFDCDLDISLVPMIKKNDGIFLQQNYLNFSSDLMKSHLSVITELLKHFMSGCTNVFYIKNAKVPIVKYKNVFTNVDCDLSLYNLHGVAMSQVLYNAASIDWRIRALVLFIKLWAHRVELVVKSPSPNLSNFSLCLMILFFFQQVKMIPPFHIFSCNENEIFQSDNELSSSFFKSQTKTKNSKSLGALLKLFFEFYESFNFEKWGISLSKGEVVNNTLGCPLYIENPLSPNLNVSANVRSNEIKYTKELLTDVVNILSNGSSSTQIEQLFCLTYKKKINFKKSSSERTRCFYLNYHKNFCGAFCYTCIIDDLKLEVAIGDVRKKIKTPKKPQYIPHKYLCMGKLNQNSLRHLRWMLQKDLLKQDIFLIGHPGPIRRQLAMIFLEMTNREIEYVSLSRDTTESDLKQRREIFGGTAKYFDQNAVRAAIEGRVLVLEGIEKAERNVLPVLNNLLENREMHLEDGRFLIPASRYDKLLKDHSKEELDKWNLVRVSDDFRVIALGLPVPKYSGNPLDPPLRSRFQARSIPPKSFQEQLSALQDLAPNTEIKKINQLLSCAYALITEDSNSLGLPDFPVDSIPILGEILHKFPNIEITGLLNRLYPYRSFLNKEGQDAVDHILKTFGVNNNNISGSKLQKIKTCFVENKALCSVKYNSSNFEIEAPCGSLSSGNTLTKYIPTDFQENLIVELLQSHVASDFCLIGPKGCGKSATVLRLANLLNYEVEPIVLYQDITSRDLIQQRNTLPNGDTVWQNSPLVKAALEGKLAILDGIHRVHQSTLSVIHSLVQDRDVQLYDGKRLVRHDRYDEIKNRHNLTDKDMEASGILKIHPSFRIVALAESLKKGVNPTKWLSAEMLSLFLFHEMRPLSYKEEKDIIQNLYGSISKKVEKILNLAVALRNAEDPTLMSLSFSFSTRQLLRISKRLSNYPDDSVYDAIQKACLARFLPPLTKEALDNAMKKEGILPDIHAENGEVTFIESDKTVKIGNTEVIKYETEAKTKVPDILFYNVPQHLALLEWLIQDFTLGEHLLLVGNQGVGKNKIADRLLQLLNRPREYIQLHRDTTVQTLTLQPIVTEGVVSYEDSPLVRAVKNGYVLVVDEADKAPTHVTCILKTLVECGEMTLSDGRKIIPFGDLRAKKPNMIEVHRDFRMIVLANRPGFPFLGNDFFGSLGDLFSCHAVDNPSPESEIALLKQYGPDVPNDIILKLVRAFGELRTMADKGLVQYPYSTREVVNIVKHIQNFPGELLSNALYNVFDFDKHSTTTLETLISVLQKNGIPVNTNKENVSLARDYPLPKIIKYGLWDINNSSNSSKNHNATVYIENIAVSAKQNLSCTKTDLDVTEVRGSVFSELYSYASLPMSVGNAVLGLAIIQDPNSSIDFINILTINPFQLCVTSTSSREVKILSLNSIFPRLDGRKYKFNLTHLAGDFSETLLIHEENLNYVLLVNILENSAWCLNVKKSGKRNYASRWKFNNQLADKNIVILYNKNQKGIEVLNLNLMTAFIIEVPLEIKSLQVLNDEKWLLQNSDDRKYLLVMHKPEDPVPSVLQQINEDPFYDLNMGLILNSTQANLDDATLSEAINEKISSPNRLLLSDECYATITVGFPELEFSKSEVYVWPKAKSHRGWTGMQGKSQFLDNASQIVTPVSKTLAPKEVREQCGTALGFLEVLNLKRRSLKYIPIPEGSDQSWYVDPSSLSIYLDKTRNDELVTVDVGGNIRYWEIGHLQLQRSLDDWQKLVGADDGQLRLTIQRDSGLDVSKPKHGKVDPDNKPHVGGNTWAGGTGGRDTAGLGGKGGPYRLDAGHDVHQISDYEKSQVPEEVKMAAREMGLKAFRQRLKEIKMSQYDHDMYLSYSIPVADQVKMLKVIIDNVQRKSKEREWVRHQTTGVLDDLKLIEGLTGEKTIFRRRTEVEPEPGAPITKPKRLKLVTDVSGSMIRFNSYDGRLNRMLEASVLVMEAFQDQEGKFKYDITGHSGDGFNIPFVEPDKPPKNNKERLEVIKTMYAHSQFCMSGDHTLPATVHAIEAIAKEECDEAIVIVLSDSNLERYRIRPSKFAQVLTSNPEVNAYAILIGSLGDQAERLAASLPAGRVFVCMDLSKIPQIMQQIFTASLLSSA